MKIKKMNVASKMLWMILASFTIVSLVIVANVINYSSILSVFTSAVISPSAAFKAGIIYINDFSSRNDIKVQSGLLSNSYNLYSWSYIPNTNAQQVQAQPSEQIEEDDQTQQQQKPDSAVDIIASTYSQGTKDSYVQTGDGSIWNLTSLSTQEISAQVEQALPFEIEFFSSEPQVLIMHTHTTETFELENRNWTYPDFTAKSTDNEINISAVGQVITTTLNNAGINTLHDTTLHDYPSYDGSYGRSYETVQQYLTQYPSIKVVIDVHRDAIQKQDGTRIKPVAEINGQTAAQVMLISCADYDGNIPNYKQNLTFAAKWQAEMEKMYPGLTRPVLFDYRYYNQDLTTGSLLLEVGGHANTLDEALYSAELVSHALISLFLGE